MSNTIYYDTKEALLAKAYSVILLVMQGIFLYSFCQGITLFYGKTVSISYAIRLVFGVFNMGSAIYRGVMGMTLGVAYFICLVLLFKNFLNTFSLMRALVFSRHRDLDTKRRCILLLDETIVGSDAALFFFVVYNSLIKDFAYNTKIYALFACGVVALILSRFVYSSMQRLTLVSILLQMAQIAVASIGVLFVLLHAQMPAIENVVAVIERVSVQRWKTDFLEIFVEILAQIPYAIVAFCIVGVMKDMSGCMSVVEDGIRTKAKRLLIVSLFVPGVAVAAYLVKGGYFSIDLLWTQCKPYVALVAASAAVFYASLFEAPEKREVRYDPTAQLGTVDKKGVLRIKEGVTSIRERAYADRRDIIEVIIPASVTLIEGNAFNGCGGIVAIHCAAKSEPRSWAASWKNGCYATVHWGSEKANSDKINMKK